MGIFPVVSVWLLLVTHFCAVWAMGVFPIGPRSSGVSGACFWCYPPVNWMKIQSSFSALNNSKVIVHQPTTFRNIIIYKNVTCNIYSCKACQTKSRMIKLSNQHGGGDPSTLTKHVNQQQLGLTPINKGGSPCWLFNQRIINEVQINHLIWPTC